jgi:hypothetical protein
MQTQTDDHEFSALQSLFVQHQPYHGREFYTNAKALFCELRVSHTKKSSTLRPLYFYIGVRHSIG